MKLYRDCCLLTKKVICSTIKAEFQEAYSMKKRLQGFFAGVAATIMLTSVFAVAKDLYKKIDVIYNDIKIEIDGERFIPKDVNGNVVEPFIHNGTTFLPVRALATAFGKEVLWDDETYTVSLNSKTENQLDSENNESNIFVSDEQLHGVWYCSVDHILQDLGVPEEAIEHYNIKMIYEYNSDGKYRIYMPETELNKLVEASFEYALLAYDMNLEEYQLVTGVSAEETKRQIRDEIDISDFSEEGEYKIAYGVLYMTVKGNSPTVQKYSISDDGVLTLYIDGVEVALTKESK